MKENRNLIIVVGVIAVLIGGAGGYWIAGASHMSFSGTSDMHAGHTMSSDVHRMHGGMQHDGDMMMDHMDMMVESERAFIKGMIPHHQEAIDTAQEVLERGGTTAEIRTLAAAIIEAQEREIVAMKEWYQNWYGEAYLDSNEYTPMMHDLSQLSGAALDRTFLEDMVMHHMGAIMMARSVEPYIEHSEMTNLTKAVIKTQSEEIQKMQRMLREL